MKVSILKIILHYILFLVFFFSCKKDIPSTGGAGSGNHSPVAIAGPDIVLTLPEDSVEFDASASYDPDNDIVSYTWEVQASGYTATQTLETPQITLRFSFGEILVILTVTDAVGLTGKDSVHVTVYPPTYPVDSCDNSNRPVINMHLQPVGKLSQPRVGATAAALGNKIFFAGAALSNFNTYGSSIVDIYDVNTNQWTKAELSESRSDIASVAAGDKVFFAGGRLGDGAFDNLYSTVDIYDQSTNQWSVTQLGEPRAFIGATAFGEKVFFAGGEKDWDYRTSNRIDIYDLLTGNWSSSQLSESRAYISAVSSNHKVYFAGGHREDRWYASPSDRIDIYDFDTNTWSQSSLGKPKGSITGANLGDFIYWAGSGKCSVDILDDHNGTLLLEQLSRPGNFSAYGTSTIIMNGKVLFFGQDEEGQLIIDIFNPSDQTWSIGRVDVGLRLPTIISLKNAVYFAGGFKVGSSSLSDDVWKLEF